MVVGEEAPVWSNLGQTGFHPRHLPGARGAYCPSDAFEEECQNPDNPYGGSAMELFGLDQARIPDMDELRGLGHLGQVETAVGVVSAILNGFITYYMISTAGGTKGFLRVVGYAGGALMALSTISSVVLAFGGKQFAPFSTGVSGLTGR